MSRNLGLNRLGVESDAGGRKWPERWRTPVQREIGRRIWWSLAVRQSGPKTSALGFVPDGWLLLPLETARSRVAQFLDFSHASAHGMAYSIHADQNLTGFRASGSARID